MKKIDSIKDELEYRAALIETSTFFENEPIIGSQEAFRFEWLLNSIEAYESKNYAIDPPNSGRITQ